MITNVHKNLTMKTLKTGLLRNWTPQKFSLIITCDLFFYLRCTVDKLMLPEVTGRVLDELNEGNPKDEDDSLSASPAEL
jgi:hypothetical protein